MLSRNHPSPFLCLLLALALAWPDAAVLGWPSPSTAARPSVVELSASGGTPHLVVNPIPTDDRLGSAVAGCDRDDGEDTDDPPLAKRTACGMICWGCARFAHPGNVVAMSTRERTPDSPSSRPRCGLLRC